jgi:hypothetical protein
MTQWAVQLTGHKFDLEDLPTWFTSPDIEVIEENGEYYLKSIDFEAFSNGADARERAKELLEEINGAGKLFSSQFRPVNIGGKIREGDKTHIYLEAEPGEIRVKGSAVVVIAHSGQVEQDSSKKETPAAAAWVGLSKKERNVKKVLRFWSAARLNWFVLYNILDVIEEDIGCEVHEKGFAPGGEVERFTRTANSYAVLGLQSRHGRHFAPPKKPMEFTEAETFIRNITNKWISSKLNLKV